MNAEWLRRALTRSGKSRKGLAEALNVAPSAVSRLLAGERQLKASEIPKVLAYMADAENQSSSDLPEQSAPQRLIGRPAIIEELNVIASAGHGAEDGDQRVIAQWAIPSQVISSITTSSHDQVKILTVKGDSMSPTLYPGQKILVDTNDKRPTPPGLFVVTDGIGLLVKRIERVHGTEPPKLRVASDNPAYETFVTDIDQVTICGRVIGGWQPM